LELKRLRNTDLDIIDPDSSLRNYYLGFLVETCSNISGLVENWKQYILVLIVIYRSITSNQCTQT